MAIDWVTTEKALHDWLAASLGAPVIWTNQKGTRPSGTYGTLQVLSASPLDYEAQSLTDLSRVGQEIEERALSNIELQISAQVFCARGTPSDITGSASGYSLLTNARMRLDLPTVHDLLEAANLVFVDSEAIQNLTAVLDTDWQSRAALTARFRTRNFVSDFITYIEQIDGGAGPTAHVA